VLRTYKQQQEVKKHNAWGLTTEVEGLKASTRQQSAELDLLRTYKQQQECKEHTAQDLAAELEEIKASTQQQSVELDVLREWHKGHETELFKSTNLSTELEHLRRAHKELQETIKLDQAEARERRKTLSPVQLLEELQATKRRRMKRVQGLKDQMKKANTIHETSPRRELDQENERLQQAIILVEQVTGLQRTIKYAEEELSKPLYTYGELGDTFEDRESRRQKILAERQDEVEPRKKKAEADLEKLWSRIRAARL
jgi:vacuolar-type H+-ATPase subunit I/STV1